MHRSTLHLKRFDPSHQLNECFNMVLLGHKHTGKSSLIRDILYRLHENRYPRVVVFSGTEEGNEFFGSCIPKAYIHHGLDVEKLKHIVDVQRKIVASCREAETELGRPPDVDTRLVIVLDDLMYKRYITRSELFGELFMNGRHWKISIILSCQYVMLLDTACRSNTDYLFVLREMIPKNRQKIYDNFFGMFPRKQDFYHVLDSCTTDYECLVLDNTQPNMAIEKCIYWYKAQVDLPEFVFGTRRFHAWAKESSAIG
jgi:hypothetical protein